MSAVDRYPYDSSKPNIIGPLTGGEPVTPSDSGELTNVSRALWVGGAGSLAVVLLEGSDLTLTGVSAGTLLPLRVKQVKLTGTTATGILSLW